MGDYDDEDQQERLDPDYAEPIVWGEGGALARRIQDILPSAWPIRHGMPVAQQFEEHQRSGLPAWAFDPDRLAGATMVIRVERESDVINPDTMTEREAEALAATAARALARIGAMKDRYGEDHEDGTIIRFQAHMGGGVPYTYAALRAAGVWYVTGGRSPQAISWDDLRMWMNNHKVQAIEVAQFATAEVEETTG